MMNWSEKHLKKLVDQGKIAGFKIMMGEVRIKIPKKKQVSKALLSLDQEVRDWAENYGYILDTEHKFDPDRKWRFDYAFQKLKIAIEFEGGVYQDKSGHKTAKHYTKDTEKYNRASVLGWWVIRVTALNYQTATERLDELVRASTSRQEQENNKEDGISHDFKGCKPIPIQKGQ